MATMDFGDRLRDKQECERIALSYWNDARLPNVSHSVLSSPKVGEAWPKEFMPHWRRWIAQRQPTTATHFASWATIRDVPFWKALSKHINDDVIMGRGLAYAGMHGNLQAFGAVSSTALENYTASVLRGHIPTGHRLLRLAHEQARIVHPDVVALMQTKGWWTQADALALAQAYQSDDVDGPSILRVDPTGRRMYGFEAGFLVDWCTKALGSLGWGGQEQLLLLAHMYAMMDARWARLFLQQGGAACLHPSIDMALVELSLGVPMQEVGFALDPRLGSLYAALESVSQSRRGPGEWIPPANCHPGLVMRMDLMPSRDFLNLYATGVACKRAELGHNEPLAMLDLPSLG